MRIVQLVHNLVGVAQLVRVRSTLAAPALTLIGGYISSRGSVLSGEALGCAVLASFTTLAFAQVLNDLCDLELDKIGKPQRPLPAGRVLLSSARMLAIFLAVASLMISTFAGRATIILTVVCLALGAAYSFVLKNTVIIGNVVVALVSSATLLFGVGAVGGARPARLFLAQALVFIYILGNELFKTGLDVEADSQANLRTIATVKGLRSTALTIGLSALMLSALFLAARSLAAVSLWFTYAGMATVALPTLLAAVLVKPWATTLRSLQLGHSVWRAGWLPGLATLVLLR